MRVAAVSLLEAPPHSSLVGDRRESSRRHRHICARIDERRSRRIGVQEAGREKQDIPGAFPSRAPPAALADLALARVGRAARHLGLGAVGGTGLHCQLVSHSTVIAIA